MVLRDRWKARTVRITLPLGTDLIATIQGEKVIIEAGFATEPGVEAAFSDGEVSQMPNEASASGVIVMDGPICYVGLLARRTFRHQVPE